LTSSVTKIHSYLLLKYYVVKLHGTCNFLPLCLPESRASFNQGSNYSWALNISVILL